VIDFRLIESSDFLLSPVSSFDQIARLLDRNEIFIGRHDNLRHF
jgi:hypothetical protein